MKKLLLLLSSVTLSICLFLFSCPVPKANNDLSPLIGTSWKASDGTYDYTLTIFKHPSSPGVIIGNFRPTSKSPAYQLAATGPVTLNGRTMTLENRIYSSTSKPITLVFTANPDLNSGTATLTFTSEGQLPSPIPPLPETITFQRETH